MQPWTIGLVLSRMLGTFARDPLDVLFFLGVLPTVWMVPASLLQSALVSAEAPVFGPGHSSREIAVQLLVSAWNCVWYAGQITASIHLARGEEIRWRPFVTGIRKAPALFLATLVATSPLQLLSVLPLPSDGTSADVVSMVAAVLTFGLLLRTVLWSPLIADASPRFWEGFVSSCRATRGHTWKLVALGFVLLPLALPLFVIEGVLSSEHFHATVGLLGVLYLLAMGQVYVLVLPMPAPVHDAPVHDAARANVPSESELR